jgi:hypothetical protein
MSIGLAILLSVLTLIAVWQIDKHAAWGKLWRVGKWLSGIGLLAAGTFGVWLYWKASADEREIRSKARVVRAGQLREYWGIKLGANENEVLYLKGEPSERGGKGDGKYWTYDNDDVGYTIAWSGRGTVVGIICSAGLIPGCDSIAGVTIGTSEHQIRQILGEPKEESGPDERGPNGSTMEVRTLRLFSR